MNFKICFLTASLVLSLNSLAAERTEKLVKVEKANLTSTCSLTTPALYPIAPNVFTCSLTNVTPKDRIVRIRIIDSHGVTVSDSGNFLLNPKHTKAVDREGLLDGGYMYCEFTVEGHKDWYRGVAKMYHPAGNDFIAVQAE